MARVAILRDDAPARGGRLELWLYVAQRLSALILAPLVLVHLAVIVYATRGGLSAAEILARTEGSALFAAVYGLFVLAAAVHAPIGLRTIVREMTPWRGRSLDGAACLFALFVLVLGLRAVAAIA
jgi:fumarate reductase subunit C